MATGQQRRAEQATNEESPAIPDYTELGMQRLQAALILDDAIQKIASMGFVLLGPAGHQIETITTEIIAIQE